jgi:hypothetical protein
MNLFERLERIKYVDYLIHSKIANSTRSISEKLNTSPRQVANLIREMRQFGAPLKYDRRDRKYYYTENKRFTFKYE